jgi:hypothetical protein
MRHGGNGGRTAGGKGAREHGLTLRLPAEGVGLRCRRRTTLGHGFVTMGNGTALTQADEVIPLSARIRK